ncbi:MAG: class I SAM-dependent rRNA methyltransferase [Desulfovibrionaceae bacterium]|nr:class I SAM-dependent rRNA methyltransferase [Desulfovibrionaceae bacterium]
MDTLVLKKGEERRIRAGHLWVFSNEVDVRSSPLKNFEPGSCATLTDCRGKALGTVYVNPASLIAARLFSREAGAALDAALLEKRLSAALALRESLFERPFYRLVHAEGDLLPGLVIDRYDSIFSIQITTAGMERVKPELCRVMEKMFPASQLVFRNDAQSRTLENLPENLDFYPPDSNFPTELTVEENGLAYSVPSLDGQKTGWFYDQRLNRRMARELAAGLRRVNQSPVRVLDAFCYAGGFGVAAAAGGAQEITFLDASRQALDYAVNNLAQGGFPHAPAARCLEGDALNLLNGLLEAGESFGLVSMDPPAFIKRKKDEEAGLAAYYRVNELGLALVQPGGFYISSSCSHHLELDALRRIIQRAASRLRRSVQLLAVGRQGPDHPAHPAMPETEYLKTLVFRIA